MDNKKESKEGQVHLAEDVENNDQEILDAIREHYAVSGHPQNESDVVKTVNAAPGAIVGNNPKVKAASAVGGEKLVSKHQPAAVAVGIKSIDFPTTDSGRNGPPSAGGNNNYNPGMPGAYALAPGGGITTTQEEGPVTGTTVNRVDGGDRRMQDMTRTSEDEEDPQAVAVAVEEGHGGLVEGNGSLPQARPFDHQAKIRLEEKHKAFRRSMVMLAGGIVLVAGIILLLVLLLVPESNDPDATSTLHLEDNSTGVASPLPLVPSLAPTFAPTFLMEGQVKSLFPSDTMISLEDPLSPQSKAFQWLMGDPHLADYVAVNWRVKQRFALATFFHALNGTFWNYNDHWLSYDHHECSWFGRKHYFFPQPGMYYPPVRHWNACEQESANGTTIDQNDASISAYKHLWLNFNNMQGSFPEELFWLTTLRSISLGKNLVEGTVPTQISKLSALEFVSLTRNRFTGRVPTEFNKLQNFTSLLLSHNQLTGTVPTELGLLGKLNTLMLDTNQFTGKIPSELFSVSSLYLVYFFDNLLTGSLPTSIGALVGVSDLLMGSNTFSGVVPSEIGLLQSLERIEIQGNAFSGTLCTELGRLSSALLSLEFQGNSFSGPIPSELGSLQNITHLMLQDNQLTGTIPREILVHQDSPGTSWTSFNFTGNELIVGLSQKELCWLNSTWHQVDCPSYNQYRMPTMCQCHCACSSMDLP